MAQWKFATEQEARKRAQEESRDSGTTMYVVESRGEFYADDESFIRSWERQVAAYENGKEVKS